METTPVPPDGGWGWVVVFASFMIHVIVDGVTYTFGIFFQPISESLEVGNGVTAWVASILMGITLGSGPIASAFVNRYGCRNVTMAGGVLAAAGFGLSKFATNIATLYFTIGVCGGFGFGLMYVPAIVMVAYYFEKKRAFATGIAVCGSGLGTFVFAPFIEFLVDKLEWQWTMMTVGGIILSAVGLGATFRSMDPDPESETPPLTSPPTSPLQVTTNSEISISDSITGDQVTTKVTEASSSDSGVGSGELQASRVAVGHVMPRPVHPAISRLQGDSSKYSDVYRLALSQPALATAKQEHQFGSQGLMPEHQYSSQRMMQKPHQFNSSASIISRPPERHTLLYRKDIFYSGSLLNIPEYRSDPTSYNMMVTRPTTDIADEQDAVRAIECACITCTCSHDAYDAFQAMMDFRLLKDKVFIFFTVTNFLTSIGFGIPFFFLVDRAVEVNIDPTSASYLLSIVGIANTLGRIFYGFLSDRPFVNTLWMYNLALITCGLATFLSPWATNYWQLALYAVVFGVSGGAFIGLTSVLLVELLGMDKLTNAFGLYLFFQGVASLIGAPIAGWMYDGLKSYTPAFYTAGSVIGVSGVVLFYIPCIKQRFGDNNKDKVDSQMTSGFKNSVL